MSRGVCIVGSPRSGTTLVQQLLLGHPEVWSPKETRYFLFLLRLDFRRATDRLMVPARRYNAWVTFVRRHLICDLPSDGPVPHNTKQTALSFVDIMSYNAERRSRPTWVEKTPGHVFHLPVLSRHIPDVRVIHIIREPTDVVASLVDVGRRYPDRWSTGNLDQAIRTAKSSMLASAKWLHHTGHMFVRCEDIVDAPIETAKHACRLLGLSYSPDIQARMESGIGNASVVRSDEFWKQRSRGGINARPTKSRYASMFNPEQRSFIEEELKEVAPLITQVPRLHSHNEY